jgi:hypothetical protein
MPFTRDDFEARMWASHYKDLEAPSGICRAYASIWKNRGEERSFTVHLHGFHATSAVAGRVEGHATTVEAAEDLADAMAKRIFETGFARDEEVSHAHA